MVLACGLIEVIVEILLLFTAIVLISFQIGVKIRKEQMMRRSLAQNYHQNERTNDYEDGVYEGVVRALERRHQPNHDDEKSDISDQS